MCPNLAFKTPGFAARDRVVIFHADNLGMCHAVNAAFADLVSFGLVTCSSVMCRVLVPRTGSLCPLPSRGRHWYAPDAEQRISALSVASHHCLRSGQRPVGAEWLPIAAAPPPAICHSDLGEFQ